QVERTRECPEPAEQSALGGVEQLVAPIEGRRKRMLPRRGGVAATPKDPEAVVEPLRNHGRAERTEPAGGELERERQALEADGDPGHVRRVDIVENESGGRRASAVNEQGHRLEAEQLPGHQAPLWIRDVKRGDAEDDLARYAQRLATRRQNRHVRCRA